MIEHEWELKRNCSLTPRQLGLAYALPCAVSFAISLLLFALQGTWLVLAFAAMESLWEAIAFVAYARHASDGEHIALMDGYLLVDRCMGGQLEKIRLDPHWMRIVAPCCWRGTIRLQARDTEIEIGRFVSAGRRRQVAKELRAALAPDRVFVNRVAH